MPKKRHEAWESGRRVGTWTTYLLNRPEGSVVELAVQARKSAWSRLYVKRFHVASGSSATDKSH